MSELNECVALITGASRGIGRCLAEELAAKGVKVFLTASGPDLLESVTAAISAAGGQAACQACDLRDKTDVAALPKAAHEWGGRLDILINNAATSLKGTVAETPDDDWELCLQVNATAPFILCRESLSFLRQSDRATIINVGSVVGLKGYAEQAAYGASKHALMGFTKVLAEEEQVHGVRVHALNPGGVATDMIKRMRPDLDTSGLMQPSEIAAIVLFLLENRGNAVLDDIHIRRAGGSPWF